MKRLTRQFLFSSVLASVALPVALSCKREERSFRVAPPFVQMPESVPYNNYIRPGPVAATTPSTSQPVDVQRRAYEPFSQQYVINAQAQSDGQALYELMNCSGCHAHGGGGMGPPLLDKKWFYGSDPQAVYISILEGRPNGMPSYRGRLPDYQIWEIVGYVRSLSGLASKNAASGREDHMNTTLPPNSKPPEKPEKVPEPATGPATGKSAMTTSTSQPKGK
jgi:cytochrome c oxidase cbb3-type subunit 3